MLTAGEQNTPGQMKIPALNQKISKVLSQESLERLYEKFMAIINLPAEKYLNSEELLKEIESYNPEKISADVISKQDARKTEMGIEEGHRRNEATENENQAKEEETAPEDLICNEVCVYELLEMISD